jgi:hypothetical protein
MLTKAQMWRAILNLADGDRSIMAQSERSLSGEYFYLKNANLTADSSASNDPTLRTFVDWARRFEEAKGVVVVKGV